MRAQVSIVSIVLLFVSAAANAQTTQPTDDQRLDYRAARAFDRGDFAAALPLLQKLATELSDKPAKLAVVQDRILTCTQALAATPTTQPAARVPHATPVPGKTLDLSIKELGNFEYDPEKPGKLPDDVQRLSGSKIRVKGFMMPIDQSDRITQFALIPSLFGCCYGQPPQIQHTIVVSCPRGAEAQFTSDEIVVEGTLKVQERKDDGYVVSLFELSANTVKSAPPAH